MEPRSEIACVIVAAGKGMRAGGGLPKQFRPLAGRSVLDRAVAAFASHPAIGRIVVVGPAGAPRPEGLDSRAEWVPGGATRALSVRAGLEALAHHAPDYVLIHDAARPLVAHELIDRVIAALEPDCGAAPGVALADTLWRVADGRVERIEPRESLFRAQTPQGFPFSHILAAHRAAGPEATDDVSVARAAGLDVAVVTGDENNFKITTAADFARAERVLAGETMEIRTGQGFDVHAFGAGDHVVLCGVRIPHDKGLAGHSDADVGLHAICDAIYGALGAGDIGRHFPPGEAQWKGADSTQFLTHAAGLARDGGWRIANIDCTLVCEAPKIAPHATAMTERIAAIAGIDADRVSVKATTSERLGFTGRGEGIAALAIATLVRP